MTENLQDDPFEINEFILNAALKKKPIFDSYRNLCEKYENRKIDYVDFEWKYYQFYHGNQDLTIQKSSENSSPLTFFDLPMEVLEKFVGKSRIVDCMILRKVSSELRNLVDSSEIHCGEMLVLFNGKYPTINFDDLHLPYEQHAKNYENDPNAEKLTIADAFAVLKNPKLKVGSIRFNIRSTEKWFEFSDFLGSGCQLNAQSVEISASRELVLPILKFINPKKLENLEIPARYSTIDQLNEIVETEQWKKARELRMAEIDEEIPIEKFLHFKEIQSHPFKINDKHLIMVRDILLKSAHLELFGLSNCSYHWDSLELKQLNRHVETVEQKVDRIMSEDPAYNRRTRRLSIPNSGQYFQLEFSRNRAFILLNISKVYPN